MRSRTRMMVMVGIASALGVAWLLQVATRPGRTPGVSGPDLPSAMASRSEVEREAIRVVRSRGERAVEQFGQRIADPRAEVREAAVLAFGAERIGSPEDLAALEPVLSDPDPRVRAAAALSIGRLQLFDGIPLLLHAMQDDDLMVRRRAAHAVARMTGLALHYRADQPPAERAAHIEAIGELWEQSRRAHGEYVRYELRNGGNP